MPFPLRCLTVSTLFALPLCASAHGAAAQDGFLFKPPAATVEVRLGRAMYTADSDLYQLITDELTLEQSDFAAFSADANLALTAASRVDIVIGLGYTHSRAPSEFRDFVDQDDMPIEQVTEVTHIPLTAGLRIYPFSRGTAIGQHAWIPARFTPFVGAGGGVNFYTFRQVGDFVDQSDFSIFNDELKSSSTALALYGEAGGEYWLSKRFGLSAVGRYTFGEATMDDDFQGSALDLRGLQGSVGLAVRF
jgi:hypothetical protein